MSVGNILGILAIVGAIIKQLKEFTTRIKEEPEVYAMTLIVVIAAVAISLIQQAL